MPRERELTAGILKEIMLREATPDRPKKRNRFVMAYARLGKLAGLDVRELNSYRIKYEPKSRDLPSDREIEAAIDKIPHPGWQWIAGVLAAFGLRPHEIFHVDISRLGERVPLLIVGDRTKTKSRIIPACPGAWVERWNLAEKRWPDFEVMPENRSNKKLGARITPNLKAYNVPWTGYAFRDCYTIRLLKYDIPPELAARLGGHSDLVRRQDYLRHLTERDIVEIFTGKMNREV